MLNEFYITFIKTFFMNQAMTYVFFKSTNNKIYKNIIFLNIIIAIVYAFLYEYLKKYIENLFLINVLVYYLYLVFLTKIYLKIFRNLILFSLCFSFISFYLASAINFIFIKIAGLKFINNSLIEYSIVGILQSFLIFVFFQIKRFKNGLSFLRECNSFKSLNNIGIILSIVIIFICIIYCIYTDDIIATILIFLLIIGGISMFYWIKRSITEYYKKQMKDRTVELQAEQLKEKDEIIKNLQEELKNVLKINHKYNHRISAMELAISKFGDKISSNEEFANEYADILDTINKLSKEYKEELDLVTNSNNLAKTNNFSIDNLLEYMKGQANKDNIEFKLKIEENINNILKIIPEGKIETLLADHIKDAIIAINFSNSNIKKIMVIIRKIDEFYEISIYDTGIEFEIDTLLKLGLENVTTHAETGGTGIGFATTFETLKECKGSLIIEEYNKEREYTKSIKIKFDGKNEYRIKSYRSDDIKKNNKTNRIIIENNQNELNKNVD